MTNQEAREFIKKLTYSEKLKLNELLESIERERKPTQCRPELSASHSATSSSDVGSE